jgi:hypothetical protein
MVSDPNADGFGLENGQMSHHYADRIGPQRPLCTIHNDGGNGQWESWFPGLLGVIHISINGAMKAGLRRMLCQIPLVRK